MATTQRFDDDKQVCYAEQDLNNPKSSVLHSSAPVVVSAPWPQHTPPTGPNDAAPSMYSASAALPGGSGGGGGWHSTSPPPASLSYSAPTPGPSLHAAIGPPPPGGSYDPRLPSRGHDRDEARIMGLRPATFFLSIALAMVVVLAAVGGGVGGSVAVENAKRAGAAAALQSSPPASIVTVTATVRVGDANPATSTTGTITGTTSTAPAQGTSSLIPVPPSQGVIDFDCRSLPQSLDIQLGSNKWSFETSCGTDLVGRNIDILGVISYNHKQCAQACASYNNNLGRNDCVGVAFQADLSIVGPNYGNCFLKNSTGTAQTKTNTQVAYRLK